MRMLILASAFFISGEDEVRRILALDKIDPRARTAIEEFHPRIVEEIERAIGMHEWVIVGMKQNVVVAKARKHLSEKGIQFYYIEHGSYFSKWKERLAIKLWTGWPTFPQIFHKGVLIGGFSDLKKYKF